MDERRRVLSYEEPDLAIHPVQAEAGARVAACFPLVVARKPLGILYVYLREARRFDPLELLMLENFVNQAAMAIFQTHQLTRVQRDLARTADELARLRRADLLISSRLKLEDTLDAILQMALEVTGAHYGIFRLVDPETHKLVTASVAGDLSRPAIEALPINATSIMGWVAKVRQPLVIPDLQANPWARIYYPLDHQVHMRSELAVPLIGAGGRLEGVLNLESPAVAAFSEQDSHLLQALATQAVIAIQDQRLLDALQEIAEKLLTQPAQTVFDRLVHLACELLNVPTSSLWVLEEHKLVLQATRNGGPRGHWIALHDSLTGQAILESRAIALDNLREDPRFSQREIAQVQGWSGALIVPLLAGDAARPSGALSVYAAADDSRRFADADWDKKVLAVLAHHAALAVQEAARREALRASEEQRAVAETFAAIGDIAANLLHRVNNKVGTIPVRVEGIQDKCSHLLEADPYLAHNLAEIERSAAEAMMIMRDSLYHLRPIRVIPVDVAECVAEAIDTSDLPSRVKVHLDGIDSLPKVAAGPRRLALVFANLLENAATAMEGQGAIAVTGAQNGAWVEIAVSDTGPGIPPELHERIFDFDFSNRKTHAGKLGFGLWWVKTLMARFGGTVAVQSDGQHGTTFVLRLPAEPAGSAGR
jgi:signal transduction histidine kinase/putative methionine-R-sulfoxide reductase with GAF domain